MEITCRSEAERGLLILVVDDLGALPPLSDLLYWYLVLFLYCHKW
jgi:hypothetical protein